MFQVEYEGSKLDLSRVDARQVRLRVFQDGEYFQFVVGVVSGFDLLVRGLDVDDAKGRLWRAVAEETVGGIKRAIRERSIPLADPTKAYEIFPDIDRAARRAAKARPIEPGDTVATFPDEDVNLA